MATEWISRDNVFAALNMCAVLERYDIKPGQGDSFRIHCPFHDDERPSCSINSKSKVFNCFSCGEQGNALDFIASMEGLDPSKDFRSVLEKAIEIIGHNPTSKKSGSVRPKRSMDKVKKSKKNRTTSKSLTRERQTTKTKTKDKPKKKLKCSGKTVQPSNDNRNGCENDLNQQQNTLDGSTDLQANKVLEAPAFPLKLNASHPWLDRRLKKMGVHPSIASELGVGFEGRSNALMAGRVCFPIHNQVGELVAYSGRWADDGEDGKFFSENGREQPRYRLPKGFQKQLELFNWHRVKEQFEGNTSIVLVEGFWSVLRLQAMTIPSVALMGLELSDAHIRLLQDGNIRSVVVMLDGDDQGQVAAKKIIAKLAPYFFTRSIPLQSEEKPDNVGMDVLQKLKALCVENN